MFWRNSISAVNCAKTYLRVVRCAEELVSPRILGYLRMGRCRKILLWGRAAIFDLFVFDWGIEVWR